MKYFIISFKYSTIVLDVEVVPSSLYNDKFLTPIAMVSLTYLTVAYLLKSTSPLS